jgi:hypothetical protein
MDQPSVPYAVALDLNIAHNISVITKHSLQDHEWLEYLAEYQAKIAPQVAELRKFLAAEAPGLGTRQWGQIYEARRAAKRKRAEQRHDVNASNIGHANAPLEAREEGDEKGAPFQG